MEVMKEQTCSHTDGKHEETLDLRAVNTKCCSSRQQGARWPTSVGVRMSYLQFSIIKICWPSQSHSDSLRKGVGKNNVPRNITQKFEMPGKLPCGKLVEDKTHFSSPSGGQESTSQHIRPRSRSSGLDWYLHFGGSNQLQPVFMAAARLLNPLCTKTWVTLGSLP